ncbi:MAG: DUF3822 family protein [Bacteroidales bacterium]|nr:DUF3822 family protein [Bacteroidales bacterium]
MAGDHLVLVNYYDRLFDQALTSQYSLSIRIDTDGLSFSVYSHLVSRYIVLESVILNKASATDAGMQGRIESGDQLDNFLVKHPWLLNQFRHTAFIYTSMVYTLIPHALYDPAKKADYLNYVHKSDDSVVLYDHFLNSAEAWVVYALPGSAGMIPDKHFNGASVMHHVGAVIETLLPRFRHNEIQNPVFVNVRKGSFDIIVLKEGKLRYCNSFNWKVNEDLVYYLVFVLDQLALNPENVPVMLLGLVEQTSSLYELLQRYIRRIDFLYSAEVSNSGIALSDSNEYKFYDLLNPGLCV